MKIIQILLLSLFISCGGQTKKNEKLTAALNDTKLELRGKVIDFTPEYRYDYYDFNEKDSDYKYFESKGFQGGGPTWAAIVYGAIQLSDPKILDQIRFDEEADGLAIWSEDKNVLVKIGRLVAAVKKDKKLLEESIAVATKDGRME